MSFAATKRNRQNESCLNPIPLSSISNHQNNTINNLNHYFNNNNNNNNNELQQRNKVIRSNRGIIVQNDQEQIYGKTLNALKLGAKVPSVLYRENYFEKENQPIATQFMNGNCKVCLKVQKVISCSYCYSSTCSNCLIRCQYCEQFVCNLCSTTNYSVQGDQLICINCNN
eukprot:TRINITY_DN3248_c0_g1_i1.p1 TRINITY_DN3248_c0_g1~~TRINITY_DN3248_c0_g1_i1.p1  ORF type:complete len:170 (-),score=67.63 TRINITY_DN3248_c0_g1_i1:27-536(-)